jgi:hypothetical protein
MRRVLILIAGSMAFWLLVALPARLLGGGDQAAIFSATALLLCLVPAVGTLAWAEWGAKDQPERQMALILGGSGLRMFFVLCTGLLIAKGIPYYQDHTSFWIWLLVCYMFTLALEMGLLLTVRPRKV